MLAPFYDEELTRRLRDLCAAVPPPPDAIALYVALIERATGTAQRGRAVRGRLLGVEQCLEALGSPAHGLRGLDDAAYERVAAAAQRLHDALHARGQGDPAMAALIGRHPRAWDRWL